LRRKSEVIRILAVGDPAVDEGTPRRSFGGLQRIVHVGAAPRGVVDICGPYVIDVEAGGRKILRRNGYVERERVDVELKRNVGPQRTQRYVGLAVNALALPLQTVNAGLLQDRNGDEDVVTAQHGDGLALIERIDLERHERANIGWIVLCPGGRHPIRADFDDFRDAQETERREQ
jgi:hypothetical protein